MRFNVKNTLYDLYKYFYDQVYKVTGRLTLFNIQPTGCSVLHSVTSLNLNIFLVM